MAGASTAAGVPIKLLAEAEGHTVVVELKTGEIFRGQLSTAEENMNMQLNTVFHTARDGRVTKLEHVYLRGSQVKFIVLPDILKNAPMFKRVAEFAASKSKPLNLTKNTGRGRGRGAPTKK